MECPSCKAAIPADSKFCIECGAPLPVPCPSCGHGNPPRAKFCASCGSNLATGASSAPAEAASPSSPPAPAPAPSSAERRQLTVMFCDLVGSTALAVRTDPEEVREVICTYRNAVAGEITRFEERVAKFWAMASLLISAGLARTRTLPLRPGAASRSSAATACPSRRRYSDCLAAVALIPTQSGIERIALS